MYLEQFFLSFLCSSLFDRCSRSKDRRATTWKTMHWRLSIRDDQQIHTFLHTVPVSILSGVTRSLPCHLLLSSLALVNLFLKVRKLLLISQAVSSSKSGPEKVQILHKSSEFCHYNSPGPVVRNAKFSLGPTL